MDFRQIPEVFLSLCAITRRDLRFLGWRGRGGGRAVPAAGAGLGAGVPGAPPGAPPGAAAAPSPALLPSAALAQTPSLPTYRVSS